MAEIKECIGQWNNCPESTSVGICRKERHCLIETKCMKVWLVKNN